MLTALLLCLLVQVEVIVAGKGRAAGTFYVSIKSLAVTNVVPNIPALATDGYTMFNVVGRGFVSGDCVHNQVWLGSTRLVVGKCNSTTLSVLVPGGYTLQKTIGAPPWGLHVCPTSRRCLRKTCPHAGMPGIQT